MYDPESEFALTKAEAIPPVATENPDALLDNERILDNILGVQHAMLRLMIPREIKDEFKEPDGEELGSFADFLTVSWYSKYSKSFRVFVDQIRSPQVEEKEERVQFRQRLITGLLTPDDYETIRSYLEAPENKVVDGDEEMGGKFLSTEKEIADFKEAYRMSLN